MEARWYSTLSHIHPRDITISRNDFRSHEHMYKLVPNILIVHIHTLCQRYHYLRTKVEELTSDLEATTSFILSSKPSTSSGIPQ